MKNILKLFILLTLIHNVHAANINKGLTNARNRRQKGGTHRNFSLMGIEKHKRRMAEQARASRPKEDGCGRCITTCGKVLKDCCAVTAALAITVAPLATYLWIKSTEIEKN